MSTLEILIAFAILTLSMTAIITVVFGNQSVAVDTETNVEALGKAQALLEEARSLSRHDFAAVVTATSTWTPPGNLTYNVATLVADITQCKKQAVSTIAWQDGRRTLTISLTTILSDIAGALALGGDCAVNPSGKKWDAPQRFAFDTLNPGKSTAIDVLKQIAYLGQDKEPFLSIADTHGAMLDANNSQDFFVTFDNNFNAGGQTIDQVNDIDVASTSGRVYAFVAMASTTAQLAVVDVTDIRNPVLKAKRQLSGITATDSTAWGWRVYYYDKKLYLTARETAGPELHVFNVSDPTNPTEDPTKGGGRKELNSTVNDFVIRNGIAYVAVDSNLRGELLLYDVSVPSAISEIVGARTNLPGSQNGESVFLIGNKLYFGRQSVASGPELYVFDASNPQGASGGLPILGAPQEIGGDVLAVRVANQFAFLVSSKSKEEFQVWDISDPSTITLTKKYNFGNIIAGGIDYEPDFIYATGDATSNFQILYSPT